MGKLNDYGIVLSIIGAVLAALVPGIASAKVLVWEVLPEQG